MVDKSLVYENESFDIKYDENGDFVQDTLETTIYMALFSEIRADFGEVSRAELRRGFWGVIFGKDFGSKIWLNNGLKTNDNLNRIIDYAKNSLNFLVENEIIKEIDVIGNFSDNGVILNITITYLDNNNKNIRIEV